MRDEILEAIKKYALSKLRESYGYCAFVDGDDMAVLSSEDREGNDIKIILKMEKAGANNPITVYDLVSCWAYRDDYFVDVLNGDKSLDEAREDLRSLIGSEYDPRTQVLLDKQ